MSTTPDVSDRGAGRAAGLRQPVEQAAACRAIQERYGPLRDLTELELRALADATAHRDRRAYQELVEEARRLDKAG